MKKDKAKKYNRNEQKKILYIHYKLLYMEIKKTKPKNWKNLYLTYLNQKKYYLYWIYTDLRVI